MPRFLKLFIAILLGFSPYIAVASSSAIFPFVNLAVIPTVREVKDLPSSVQGDADRQADESSPEEKKTVSPLQFYWKTFPKHSASNLYYRHKLREEADAGNSDSSYKIGQMYLNGNGTLADYYKAFNCFLQSAKSNNADAQFWLAEAYGKGQGTVKNDREAIYWYQKAAENGNVGGEGAIGMAYLFGIGVKKDPKQAYQWLQKAADAGNPRAQYLLSKQYRFGEGVEKDQKLANQWLKKSANGGWADARWDYILMQGNRYINHHDNPDEMKVAVDWLKEAITNDESKAQQLLGWLYQTGTYLPTNYPEAVRLYSAASAQGNLEAQFSLGVMYAEGTAVHRDCTQAISLLEHSAESGLGKSAVVLGNLYKYGICFQADNKMTAHWYLRAVEKNFISACGLLVPPVSPALLNQKDLEMYQKLCLPKHHQDSGQERPSKDAH